jgi:hypothetical protein
MRFKEFVMSNLGAFTLLSFLLGGVVALFIIIKVGVI